MAHTLKKSNVTGKAGKNVMLSIQATPDLDGIRTAEFQGTDHTVIPCIALCEGVLWPANAPHPELALAEEFGRFPEAWNGKPVMLGHPMIEGIAVSANHPQVLESDSIGIIFNTKVVGKQLHMELWINTDRVSDLGVEAVATVERLVSGEEMVEVSTGLFTMQEMVSGDHDGQPYSSIWRNIMPDHLAVLSKGATGACSIKGGCGAPRLNGESEFKPVMRAMQLKDNCSCDTVTTSEEGLFKRLLSSAQGVFGRFISNDAHNLSDRDLHTALEIALKVIIPDEFTWILAVFVDDGIFVHEQGFTGILFQRTFSISDDGTVTIGSEAIAVRPETKFVPLAVVVNSDDGDLETNSTQPPKENEMETKEQLVKALIANEGTNFTQDDSAWLTTLDEVQLVKLTPVVAEEADATPAVAVETSPGRTVDDIAAGAEAEIVASAAAKAAPQTTEEFLAAAPPAIRAALQNGLSVLAGQKAGYIKVLTDNTRCSFTAEQLEAKDVEELRTLCELGNLMTFETAGANMSTEGVINNASGDEGFTPAPDVFASSDAS